jgi:hypothetical protein
MPAIPFGRPTKNHLPVPFNNTGRKMYSKTNQKASSVEQGGNHNQMIDGKSI